LFTRDTIWFDPVSIALGEVAKLKLPPSGQSKFEALDVVPVVHTYLRLRLRMFGFTVEYYHYDWRQSIAKLGQELANKIRSSQAAQLMLVAHSMGGLV
jgi:pimeloyl-ACP methyl ester carboxylesterase